MPASYELFVIEDACQAHGAEYKGQMAGSIGDAGCFSFYPGKNLGAYGEAGAVTTNNAELAERISIFRDHGQSKKYHHQMIGWNSRMDGLQGAILNVKLKHLSAWNDARRKNARTYNDLLSDLEGVITPHETDYARHVYHIYALRVRNRDRLLQSLAEADIHCGIHYPVLVHLQEAYNSPGIQKNNTPLAEKYAARIISLPMYPEISYDQQAGVREKILEFLANLNIGFPFHELLIRVRISCLYPKRLIRRGCPFLNATHIVSLVKVTVFYTAITLSQLLRRIFNEQHSRKKRVPVYLLACFLAVFGFIVASASAADIVIDNLDAASTSSTGTWLESGGDGEWAGSSYWSRNGDTFSFIFNCPATGLYQVLEWHSTWSSPQRPMWR